MKSHERSPKGLIKETVDMKSSLPVHGTQAVRKRYRHLLTSEWTESTLDQVVELVDAQLPESRKLFDLTFNGTMFDLWERGSQPLLVNSVLVELMRANEDLLGAAPPTRITTPSGTRLSRRWIRYLNCLTSLVLPIRYRLEGDAELFLDSLSLLFLQSIHAFAPGLRDKQTGDQTDLLWHVMALHCSTAWQHNLAHQQYLLSCLFHELNLPKREEQALRNSFSLTDLDDHDFLSKAQAVWYCLADQRRLMEAREFILYVARIAPPTAIEELREMMEDSLVPAKSA
jgi:hypothetical protein